MPTERCAPPGRLVNCGPLGTWKTDAARRRAGASSAPKSRANIASATIPRSNDGSEVNSFMLGQPFWTSATRMSSSSGVPGQVSSSEPTRMRSRATHAPNSWRPCNSLTGDATTGADSCGAVSNARAATSVIIRVPPSCVCGCCLESLYKRERASFRGLRYWRGGAGLASPQMTVDREQDDREYAIGKPAGRIDDCRHDRLHEQRSRVRHDERRIGIPGQ